MSAYDDAVLQDAPLAFWPLNETSGTVAADISGNGNDGTYTGGFTLGQVGIGDGEGAVLLNGSTGFVLCKNGAILSGLPSWSIEAWYRSTDAAGDKGIYCERSSVSGNDIVKLTLNIQGGPPFDLGNTYRDDAGNLVQLHGTSHDDHLGQLVYAVTTVTGTTATVYFNAAQVGQNTGITVTNTLTNASLVSAIGKDAAPTATFLAGTVAKVALYDVALTPGQIATHFQAANIPAFSPHRMPLGA